MILSELLALALISFFPSISYSKSTQNNNPQLILTDYNDDGHLTDNDSSSTEYEYVEVVDEPNNEVLPELCLLPEQRGGCSGSMLRYRFDSESRRCLGFLYSGCRMNMNNFLSEEACERACGRWRNVRVCEQLPDDGECPGSQVKTLKWYFSMASGECRPFHWTGCSDRSNGNIFSGKAECENFCHREQASVGRDFWRGTNVSSSPSNGPQRPTSTDGGDRCRFNYDSGPCEDYVEQWYFDHRSNQCRMFTWGGCRGNSNRFNNKIQCEKACIQQSEQHK